MTEKRQRIAHLAGHIRNQLVLMRSAHKGARLIQTYIPLPDAGREMVVSRHLMQHPLEKSYRIALHKKDAPWYR